MRMLALLLALANALFFAWTRYVETKGSPESHLVNQQINPEAIRLLSPAEAAERKGGEAASEPQSAAGETAACVEWGAFSIADAKKASAGVAGLAATARIDIREVEEAAGWWVFMPPQGTRQAAIQKVGELQRLGVQDYFILVQDDPKLRFAISLGIFSTEEAARARLQQLRGQGVKTAQVGPRQTPVRKVFLQIRDLPEALALRLEGLRKAFPATEFKACPAEGHPSDA